MPVVTIHGLDRYLRQPGTTALDTTRVTQSLHLLSEEVLRITRKTIPSVPENGVSVIMPTSLLDGEDLVCMVQGLNVKRDGIERTPEMCQDLACKLNASLVTWASKNNLRYRLIETFVHRFDATLNGYAAS